MKKITLDLDRLEVESVVASHENARVGEGTVFGNAPSNAKCNSDFSCLPETCAFQSCLDTQCYCTVRTLDCTCDSCDYNNSCVTVC